MTRRTLFRLLLAMLLGSIGWAGATSTAFAGGPTSVLMTNPESGRASALHIANAAYDRLYAAVGAEATGDSVPPSGLSSGEEEVRLTWLIHDMQIWRIDRVHLTRQDGIWIETVVEPNGDGDVFDRPSRWHRANDEQALTSVLVSAGLVGADSVPNDVSSVTAASSPPSQAVLPIVVAGIGGLAVGAVGSLLLRRRRTVDRPRVTLSG